MLRSMSPATRPLRFGVLRNGCIALAPALLAPPALGSEGNASLWWSWLVIGAIVLLVAGIVARMVLAARFPRNYREWARERRDDFAARNDAWDRRDEEFRK